MAIGLILVNRILSEFGQLVVAGYGAGSKVDMLVALPILGLASAAMTVIGMFAGANRSDLVRSTAIYIYKFMPREPKKRHRWCQGCRGQLPTQRARIHW